MAVINPFKEFKYEKEDAEKRLDKEIDEDKDKEESEDEEDDKAKVKEKKQSWEQGFHLFEIMYTQGT